MSRRWKDQKHPLRQHPEYRVTGVPTLIRQGTPRRLVEEDCTDEGKLTMLFED